MKGKITICNRLKGSDSVSKQDIWYSTILDNVDYKIEQVLNTNSSNIKMEQSFLVLIPFSTQYMAYNTWKNKTNKEQFFTLSQGDYIFLSEITDIVTPQTITSLRLANTGRVCEVRSISEVENKFSVKYQFKVTGV